MKSKNFTVTIDIDVWDARALIQAARAKARADGTPLRNCTTREALQWLFDPGVSPPGTDINESYCDQTEFAEVKVMVKRTLHDNVVSLFGKEPELAPTPVDVSHLFVDDEKNASREAGIDLSGKSKILFLMGAGATGKTTFARWVAERAEQRDPNATPVLVSVDPLKRDLAQFHPQTLQPRGTNAHGVVIYLEKLFMRLIEVKRSALIDFGGGDTALMTLLAQTPELHTMLEEAGVEPVALYFLSPRTNDLTPLVAMERAGFRPRATALVLNVGRTDLSKPIEDWFATVRNHPEYKRAVDRGAVEVWFPKLHAAKAIEDRTAGFWAVTNHSIGDSATPLGMFDRRRVSVWLAEMDEHLQPIASWLDL